MRHLHALWISGVILLVVLMSGCSSDTSIILTKAQTALQTIKTCTAEMTMEYKFTIGQAEESLSATDQKAGVAEIDARITSTRIYLENPLRIKTSGMASINGRTNTSEYYVIQQENSIRYYMPQNNAWFYLDLTPQDGTLSQSDPKSKMAFVFNNSTNLLLVGAEQIEGREAYHLQSTLSGENLIAFIEELRLTDSLSHSGNPEVKAEFFDLETIVTEQVDQAVDIWIDKNSLIPIRYTMDLRSLTYKLLVDALQKAPDTADMPCRIETCVVSVIYKDINNTDDFELPPEAENAESLLSI